MDYKLPHWTFRYCCESTQQRESFGKIAVIFVKVNYGFRTSLNEPSPWEWTGMEWVYPTIGSDSIVARGDDSISWIYNWLRTWFHPRECSQKWCSCIAGVSVMKVRCINRFFFAKDINFCERINDLFWFQWRRIQ